MSRGFNDFNRTFMARAPNFNGPVRREDEAGSHFHRTDLVRLRHHPCLRLPSDPPLHDNEKKMSGFDALLVDDGVVVGNASGITMIEVWINDRYRAHREYTAENLPQRRSGALPAGPDEMATEFPQNILVRVSEWRAWAGGWNDSDKVQLVLTSRATATDDSSIELGRLLREGSRTDPDGTRVFSSAKLGKGEMSGSESFRAPFTAKHTASSLPTLRSIEIHSGNYIDGFRLHLSDGSQKQIGKCQGGSKTVLDIDDDDDLDHVAVNSGWWIDGLEFVTRKGKRSGWKGGKGGDMHIVRPPPGYVWMGLEGSGAAWLDSLTMWYAKQK
ncbi:hypothetical protein GGI05_001710 [Coemansia sp. RSA 2603]|nr:hypothetical protein GGI05_001710 [Coemansia sp. RSA 2603]